MLGLATAAFGGSSIITAILMFLIKMWDRKQEAKERDALLDSRNKQIEITALDAIARRTNNNWGNFTRFILAMVPQFVIIFLLIVGYNNPDVVIWVSTQTEPKNISLLFGFIEFTIPQEITWRHFNGIVILPAMFAQMGAVNTYFLIGGTFSRR